MLLRANSLLASGENLTEILGFSTGGLSRSPMVSTATAFRVGRRSHSRRQAAALALMRYRAPLRVAAAQQAESLGQQVREGLSFLRHHRGLLVNTAMVVAVAGLGASYPLTFFLAVRVLHGGPQAFGLFEAAVGLGYLVGSLILAALATRVRLGYATTLGLMVMGLGLVIVAVTGAVWQACMPFALVGLANAAALVCVGTRICRKWFPNRCAAACWAPASPSPRARMRFRC